MIKQKGRCDEMTAEQTFLIKSFNPNYHVHSDACVVDGTALYLNYLSLSHDTRVQVSLF
jgi:hypothetical protein